MFNLAQPHGDKLAALLDNNKLPPTEKPRVNQAIEHYINWLETLKNISGDLKVVPDMVSHLTSYKRYIDVELIFDSDHDFLYRQKGQLKLDNSIIEEFIPITVEGRKKNRDYFVNHLDNNPFAPEVFMRFLTEIEGMIGKDELDEDDVLSRGYF